MLFILLRSVLFISVSKSIYLVLELYIPTNYGTLHLIYIYIYYHNLYRAMRANICPVLYKASEVCRR